MNKLAKTAALAGVGAAVYGGAYLETRYGFDTPAEHNHKVAVCAAGLGETALQSNNIPDGCGEFTDSIPAFEFRGRTVYLLPPKELFTTQNVITPQEAAHDRVADRILDGVGATMGVGAIALVLRERRPRKVTRPEIASKA